MNNDKLFKNAQHLFEVCHKTKPLMLLQSGSNGYFLSMEFQTLDDGQAVHSAMVHFFDNTPKATKLFKFELVVCGGPMDDPWENTIVQEGTDMLSVLQRATKLAQESNSFVVSISQMD